MAYVTTASDGPELVIPITVDISRLFEAFGRVAAETARLVAALARATGHQERARRCAIEQLGIPESDIRNVTARTIVLWNHRVIRLPDDLHLEVT